MLIFQAETNKWYHIQGFTFIKKICMGHYFMSMSALSSQITNSCLALSSFIGLSGHAIEDKSFAHLYIPWWGAKGWLPLVCWLNRNPKSLYEGC